MNATTITSVAVPSEPPRLLDGTELLGRASGSGFKEPPYLIRRQDGQVVQVSGLLYALACRMDGRSAEAIAADAGEELQVRLRPDQVDWVVDEKLAPLGLVAFRDGTVAPMKRRTALLGLRLRVQFIPARVVNAIVGPLSKLFVWPIVAVVLGAVAALDAWLFASHEFGKGLTQLVGHPKLIMALFLATMASYVIHEFGHAASCRYGGARPGAIGAGIYIVWPAFYTDVTDSYRLSRGGRLRVDFGGVYFNLWISIGAGAAYLATGFAPLLILCVTQQMLILDQFLPWMRLDGYHVISDLIGVPDLFARIGPILASLNPRAATSPRVSELKPWARAAVTAWVLTAMGMLGLVLVVLGTHVPEVVRTSWRTFTVEIDAVSRAWSAGDPFVAANAVIDAVFLVLPTAAILYLYLSICRGLGRTVAIRQVRRELRRRELTLDGARAAEPSVEPERAAPQPAT